MPDLHAALHQGFLAELTEPARGALAGDAVRLADVLAARWQAARGVAGYRGRPAAVRG